MAPLSRLSARIWLTFSIFGNNVLKSVRLLKKIVVSAALLGALIPCRGHATSLTLYASLDGGGAIVFTSPTSFTRIGVLDGDACFYNGFVCGSYGFPIFSGLGGPRSIFTFLGVGAFMAGTVEWTSIKGYPARSQLIGTLRVTRSEVFQKPEVLTPQFLADFPIGAGVPITVNLRTTIGTGVVCPAGIASCYVIDSGAM